MKDVRGGDPTVHTAPLVLLQTEATRDATVFWCVHLVPNSSEGATWTCHFVFAGQSVQWKEQHAKLPLITPLTT